MGAKRCLVDKPLGQRGRTGLQSQGTTALGGQAGTRQTNQAGIRPPYVLCQEQGGEARGQKSRGAAGGRGQAPPQRLAPLAPGGLYPGGGPRAKGPRKGKGLGS